MKKWILALGLIATLFLILQQQKPVDEDCPCKDEDGECIPCPAKPE